MFTGLYLLILVGGQGFLDAHAYWATDLAHLYQGAIVGGRDAYLYSPAFAQLIWPLTQLPFPAFAAVWVIAEGAGLLWLLRPLPWSWQVPFLLLASPELVSGNIHVFLAVAIVLGFRYPVAWAVVLLTKVTPGIGLLWFAVRREWRSLAIAVGATAGRRRRVVPGRARACGPTGSGVLQNNTGTGGVSELAIPIWLRLPPAVVIVVWGALTGRRWTVAVAATLAVPAFYLHTLTMLYAIFRLQAERRRE